MLKVAKFGGSSMADAKQFEKVRDIVRADPARRVIVVFHKSLIEFQKQMRL